jgi:hypothetical protein
LITLQDDSVFGRTAVQSGIRMKFDVAPDVYELSRIQEFFFCYLLGRYWLAEAITVAWAPNNIQQDGTLICGCVAPEAMTASSHDAKTLGGTKRSRNGAKSPDFEHASHAFLSCA